MFVVLSNIKKYRIKGIDGLQNKHYQVPNVSKNWLWQQNTLKKVV